MTGEVDRGAAAERLCVERGIGRHVMADVRDVHAEQIVAVFERFERNRVVEVLRIIAVDGENQLVAQVEPLAGGGEIDLLRNGVGLTENLVRKDVIDAVLVQNGRDGSLHRAVFAERGGHDALRTVGVVAVVRYRDRHAVARLRLADVAAVHRDFGVFLGRGLYEERLAALHQLAGQLLAGAADNADNGRLAAAPVVLALADLDEHLVAVPRAAARIRGNEQVVRLGRAFLHIGRNERKAALGREKRAGRAAVVRGDRKAVFLVLHDFARLRQTVECVLDFVLACVGQDAAYLIHAARLREQRQQPAVKRIFLHGFPSDLS